MKITRELMTALLMRSLIQCALVIIDYDDAVANGYAHFADDLEKLRNEEAADD